MADAAQERTSGFSYSSLDTIRLLRIFREDSQPKLVAHLENFCLDSFYCPKFFAVSYVWGTPPKYSKSIILNGFPFVILESLYSFLELICDQREFTAETWWWIDSICINQQDMSERNTQVQLMGRIYKQAQKTIVWLGEKSEDSDEGIESLQRLHRKRWKYDKKGSADIDRSKFRDLRDLKSGINWAAVQGVLLRAWWRRVWTIQEFIIATELDLYCGSKSISRSRFKSSMYAIWLAGGSDNKLIKKGAFDSGWNRRRMHTWYFETHPMSLVAMISYVGDCTATDPRDRIYSLLGIATDRSLVPQSDYELSVGEVYTKLVESFVNTYKCLDIVCFGQLFVQMARDSTHSLLLPSWVPDWRIDPGPETDVVRLMACQSARFKFVNSRLGKTSELTDSYIGNFRPLHSLGFTTAYAASRDSQARVTFLDIDMGMTKHRILSCEGIIVDSIDGLGGMNSQCFIQSTSPMNQPLKQDSAVHRIPEQDTLVVPNQEYADDLTLLESISRSLVLDRSDKYLNHVAEPSSTCADLQAFCKATTTSSGFVDNHFVKWFEQNRSLLIKGRCLDELVACQTPFPTSEITNFKDASGNHSFLRRFRNTTSNLLRRLFSTNKGHLGMAPAKARKGDVVCVLLGCNIPVVLRQKQGIESKMLYEFVGECYLHEFMAGKAIDDVDSGIREVTRIWLQ